MSHDLVLEIFDRVLVSTRRVLDEPEVLVDDLRGLIGALHLTLRRYRGAVAEVAKPECR